MTLHTWGIFKQLGSKEEVFRLLCLMKVLYIEVHEPTLGMLWSVSIIHKNRRRVFSLKLSNPREIGMRRRKCEISPNTSQFCFCFFVCFVIGTIQTYMRKFISLLAHDFFFINPHLFNKTLTNERRNDKVSMLSTSMI